MDEQSRQQDIQRRLNEVRTFVESGDGLAVIEGIRICAVERVPIPDWLADEFVTRSKRVLADGAETWDEAFGKPWPGVRGKRAAAWNYDRIRVHQEINRRQKIQPVTIDLLIQARKAAGAGASDEAVFSELQKLRAPEPIDERLFNAVGKLLGMSGSKVRDLYYESDDPLKKAASGRRNHANPS